MARTLTPIDVHAIMNALYKQATGQTDLTVVDTSTFISAGEKMLSTSTTENILNSLTLVLTRTIVSARPYTSPLRIIRSENSDMYSSRVRKISFYSKEALPSGDFNTQLYTNLADGYDNGKNNNQSTESMWKQNPPVPLELTFGGSSVWQDSYTVYKYQLKTAFSSESEFAKFVEGWMTEKANDIEQQKESFDRAVLLNGIAGTVAMDNSNSVVNLTELFNETYNTDYTSAELLSTYKTDFMKFFVATFKTISKRMTHRSANYHWSPSKTVGDASYTLLRHTPYTEQKVVMYEPFFIDAQATVLPEIFNPEYLDLKTQVQFVDFWQNENSPSRINIKPVVVDKVSKEQKTHTSNIEIPYVLGIIYDKDFMMSDYMMDDAESTPMEARKRYYNVWYSMVRNGIVDYTENAIVFIMSDN